MLPGGKGEDHGKTTKPRKAAENFTLIQVEIEGAALGGNGNSRMKSAKILL